MRTRYPKAEVPEEFRALEAKMNSDIDRICRRPRPQSNRARMVASSVRVRLPMGYPTIESEPTLEEWLEEHGAELVWQTESSAKVTGVPALLIACYRFPSGRSALVTVAAHGCGWDIATSSGSDESDRVLADAEERLGL